MTMRSSAPMAVYDLHISAVPPPSLSHSIWTMCRLYTPVERALDGEIGYFRFLLFSLLSRNILFEYVLFLVVDNGGAPSGRFPTRLQH